MALNLKPWSLAALAALSLCQPALAHAEEPQAGIRQVPANQRIFSDEVIYLIMVDRFANGDKRNDQGKPPMMRTRPGPGQIGRTIHTGKAVPGAMSNTDRFGYHGGDLAGVRQKLGYLADLGVTALWLTPVQDNQNNALDKKYWGYHGYWIQDFDRVDEHFGDEDTLKALVADAHARGIKVYLDVVVNHPGYDAAMVKDPKYTSWFHHNGSIKNWDDPYQNENYDLVGLPDFNSENVKVLEFMQKAWGGWITRTGIDGFRLDTVRHVPKPFWKRFNAKMREVAKNPFFIVGEVSYHDPRLVAPYFAEAGLDATFDFPMFETLVDVFAKGKSPTLLAARFAEDRVYPRTALLSPFIDNHDETRFMTAAGGDKRKLKLGLACLLTMRGIPSLLYGTEVGMPGGRDPDNRHDMPWGANPDLHAFTRELLHIRKTQPALRRGNLTVLHADEQVVVYARQWEGQSVVVALNNSDATVTRQVPLLAALSWPAGTRLVNLLMPEGPGGRPGMGQLVLAPKQAQIWTSLPDHANKP